jgi:multiple sugar transport system permease protein
MLRTIWIATFADLIFVMTEGGPAGSTNTVPVYIYVSAFKSLDKGYASAVAVLLRPAHCLCDADRHPPSRW